MAETFGPGRPPGLRASTPRRGEPSRLVRAALIAWVVCVGPPARTATAHPSVAERRSILEEREREATPDSPGQRDARGWFDRGRLLAEAGDAPGALRAYEMATSIDPGLPGLDRARAAACLAAGLDARGLESVERHLRTQPDDPRGLALRARLLARLGRPAEAVEEWNRLFALAARPEPDHAIERARASVASGDVPGALRGLDEARARLGAVPAIDHLAVDLEVGRGDFDGALRRIDRASGGRAPRGTWELRRAETLEAAGRRDESRAAYAAALSEMRSRAARGRGVPTDSERRAADGLVRTGGDPPRPSVAPSPGS